MQGILETPGLTVAGNLEHGRVKVVPKYSVADQEPGSGAFLTPGSGIGFFRIPDLGSRIPNPYFWELSDNFLG